MFDPTKHKLRCASSLSRMNVFVFTGVEKRSYKHSYFDHIEDMIAALPDIINRTTSIESAALVFTDLKHYRLCIKQRVLKNKRYVIVELNDAATCLIRELKHLSCAAVLKPTVLARSGMHAGPLINGRQHFTELNRVHKLFPAAETNMSPIDPKLFRKVYCILPHLKRFISKMESVEPVPLHDRVIDVSFLGTINYGAGYGQLITQNRQLLIDTLQRMSPALRTFTSRRKLGYDAYLANITNSKMFVSPYGWGEFSHKDFEVALLGGVLIKPLCGNFKCYPNIYEPDVTCVSCALDYSDLEEIVTNLLREPERMSLLARNMRKRVDDFMVAENQTRAFRSFLSSIGTSSI